MPASIVNCYIKPTIEDLKREAIGSRKAAIHGITIRVICLSDLDMSTVFTCLLKLDSRVDDE